MCLTKLKKVVLVQAQIHKQESLQPVIHSVTGYAHCLRIIAARVTYLKNMVMILIRTLYV